MSLPGWLNPLYTAEEMRAADEYAIETAGVDSLALMERAGAGLAQAIAEVCSVGPIRFVVGKGNNGGDGLVAARLLRRQGRDVEVLSVYPLEELRGDAATNLERLGDERPTYLPQGLDASRLAGAGAVVDCLLGTGFSGAPRDPIASAIVALNACASPVIACDVPSGVDAATGQVAHEAVRATSTATFHASKIGLHVTPGALFAGDVHVFDIGIPAEAPQAQTAGLMTPQLLGLIPHRSRMGTKFDSGTVVIAGGARGLTGAPSMAALAAARSGAGYVQVAVPRSLEQIFELRLLEPMTHGLDDLDGALIEGAAEAVVALCERADALVLGPGIGRSQGAFAFARSVAQAAGLPCVIDADGLNAHAGFVELLRRRDAATVLTPHAGELGRLLDRPSAEVSSARLACARDAAQAARATVVLKGDDTLVVAPDGRVAVSPGATPALATAGTGDVLSGLIGALCGKGLSPWEAACAGVLGHARAGRLAANKWGADHTVASDVIESLPEALSDAGGED